MLSYTELKLSASSCSCKCEPEWAGDAPHSRSKTSAGCPQSLEVQSPPLPHRSASTLWRGGESWDTRHPSDTSDRRPSELTGHRLVSVADKQLTVSGPQRTARACRLFPGRPPSAAATDLRVGEMWGLDLWKRWRYSGNSVFKWHQSAGQRRPSYGPPSVKYWHAGSCRSVWPFPREPSTG